MYGKMAGGKGAVIKQSAANIMVVYNLSWFYSAFCVPVTLFWTNIYGLCLSSRRVIKCPNKPST